MKNMKDDSKTWQEINAGIRRGKTSPEKLSAAQWDNILKKSAEELEAKKNQPNKNAQEPYCNIYARYRMLNAGIYMPPDQNANQMIAHMESHPELFEKLPKKKDADDNPTLLDHRKAQDLSERGNTVVSTYRNPNNAKHGHIAIVNGKAGMKSSDHKHWNTNVPSIDGYDTKKGHITEGESLSWQFTKDKEPHMDYYVFRGRRSQLR